LSGLSNAAGNAINTTTTMARTIFGTHCIDFILILR
jgi:hypothetical protein